MTGRLSLLGVFAHPDDEIVCAGALAHYRQAGARVALICATRGEEGEIAPGTPATKDTLGDVRTQELQAAMAQVGVTEIYFLGYRDSGMEGTPANQNPDNLHNAPLDEVTARVVKIVREVKPQVLLTFDPQGGYGHPDHLKTHAAAMAAFARAGDPAAYPEQLADGLAPHTPQKIYWTAFSPDLFQEMANALKAAGIDLSQFGAFNPERRTWPRYEITARIDVSAHLDAKERAWRSHATQQNPNSPLRLVPRELIQKFWLTENYVLAESRVNRPTGIEDDLFTGVGTG